MDNFVTLVEYVRSSGGVNNWIAHPVFDGAPAPSKANEDLLRATKRQNSLAEALDLERLGQGTSAKGKKLYDSWWRPSYLLVHEICIALSARCVPFTVAPYEADPQLGYLCNKAAPGTSLCITKDSDLAIVCERVFFWDRRYDPHKRLGGGLYCVRKDWIGAKDGKLTMTGFTDEQVIAVGVLAGCDYVSKEDHAKGVGFVTAVSIVRTHKTLDAIVKHAVSCGKFKVTPDTDRSLRAAFYHFKYSVVYDCGTGSHVHSNAIPENELTAVSKRRQDSQQ